ncbi:hypothetical protein KKF59_01110 [Patescibacteria group bacterium]|nr:hypothetical protein [Patescibacteria group bacterium]MBU1907712.1 hypothetical protein [Patescibacteria group bacterium]
MFFEIPNDRDVMASLVEAVPSDWSAVDGWLLAPENLIDSERVARHIGFAMQTFHGMSLSTIESGDQNSKQTGQDLVKIILGQKLPGFLTFAQAGHRSGNITLMAVRQIAAGFLRMGYRGGLRFCRHVQENENEGHLAKCSFMFDPWYGSRDLGNEAGPQPARIKIEWQSGQKGGKKDFVAIVAICRSLKLRKYKPKCGIQDPAFKCEDGNPTT